MGWVGLGQHEREKETGQTDIRTEMALGLGRDFSVFGGLDWVGSTVAKVLKI